MDNYPYPLVESTVFHTSNGTPYLQSPGVITLAYSIPSFTGLATFLSGFDADLQFDDYLLDPDSPPPLESLTKVAGQLCYMSFGPKRTKNTDADKYLENIKSSGHGSVLEHSVASFLLYGLPRHITHELVRHRAGTAFSQVSQRYVSGAVLRFVERPEYQADEWLHDRFERRIDRDVLEYNELVEYLMKIQLQGAPYLAAENRTDLRKRVQQSARSELANHTEAPMVMSANIRSWRHILEMRADSHAETEIRQLLYAIYTCLTEIAPLLFSDYVTIELPDGTYSIKTPFKKV